MSLILITRPQPEADIYAQELQALGFETMVQPVLEITPQAFEIPDLSRYQALIFTSGNGVRFFAERSQVFDIPVFTVGDQTRAAAMKAGFTHVSSAGGAASDLIDLIARSAPDKARPLLHARGYHTALPIHILLQEQGFNVDLCVVYKADPAASLKAETMAAIKESRIAAIPFFSKRTAESFLDLVQKNGLAPSLSSIKALSMSASVLECVQPYTWQGTYLSDAPDKASLTKLLQRVCV